MKNEFLIFFALVILSISAFFLFSPDERMQGEIVAGSLEINGIDTPVYVREDGKYVVSVGTKLCKPLPWDKSNVRCDRRNEILIFDREFKDEVYFGKKFQ